jgi:hypothetical protein
MMASKLRTTMKMSERLVLEKDRVESTDEVEADFPSRAKAF